ncbi:hypothetical protein V8G54_029008 [Vigna mungo]|uniref:Uncharacterized protein n=1 Tax=Vigna mungo TaxID=3915 RepID=A0AAQ3MT35_VIGMU
MFFSLMVSKVGFHPFPDNCLFKYSGLASRISGRSSENSHLSSFFSLSSSFLPGSTIVLFWHKRVSQGTNFEDPTRDFECRAELRMKRMRRVSSPLNPTGFPRLTGSIRYALFVSNLLSAGNGVGLFWFTAECNSTTTCSGCSSISSATVTDCSISCTEPSHNTILPLPSEERNETWLPISHNQKELK